MGIPAGQRYEALSLGDVQGAVPAGQHYEEEHHLSMGKLFTKFEFVFN